MFLYNHSIKPLLFVFFVVLFGTPIFSQPTNNIVKEAVMPPPNAASLGKYADIPVSYHTGVPNISVPIYTVVDGPLSLPVSLNYHSSGIKVDELASWVGLGWSLHAGGVISRTVMGSPDEGITPSSVPGYPLTTLAGWGYYTDGGIPQEILDCSNQPGQYCEGPSCGGNESLCRLYYMDAANGFIDTEPDMFSFNVNGASGKFFFDENKQPHFVPEQNVKVFPLGPVDDPFASWKLITTDGTKYFFGGPNATETAYTETTVGSATPSSTSWYLTRMESADGHYAIDLNYITEQYSYQNRMSHSVQLNGLCQPTGGGNVNIAPTSLMTHKVDGVRLVNISTTRDFVHFIATTARTDLTAYGNPNQVNTEARSLDRIEIHHGNWCKKFQLDTDYFVSDPASSYPTYPSNTTDTRRLKLNSVTEGTCTGSIVNPPHVFEYNEDSIHTMARRFSLARDHWGYYNGVETNQGLLPYDYLPGACSFTGTADRDPREAKMKSWILEKITYPTGGYSEFSYEAHQEINMVGGLRIGAMTTKDEQWGPPLTKSFSYELPRIYNGPFNGYYTDMQGGLFGANNIYANDYPPHYPRYILNSTPNPTLSSAQGYHIGYGKVTETRGDGLNTVYRFIQDANYTFTVDYPMPPIPESVRGGVQERMEAGPQVMESTFEEINGVNVPARKIATLPCVYGQNGGTCGEYTDFPFYTNYNLKSANLLTKTTTETLDGVTTTTTYEYAGIGDHPFPTAVEFTNSDGKVHRTENAYVFDYPYCTAVKEYLLDSNLVATPFKVEQKVDGVLVGGSESRYEMFQNGQLASCSSGSGFFPRVHEVYDYEMTFSGNTPNAGVWELSGTIASYENGYPTAFTKKNWSTETYTWNHGLISTKSFEDFTWNYSYHPNSRLVATITDIDGQSVDYDYDQLMRLKTVSARGGAVTTDYSYHYRTSLSDHNYVRSSTNYEEVAPESALLNQSNYQYLDGLGRLMQNVKVGYSPAGKDVIEAVGYDAVGRQMTTYIPWESPGSDGAYTEVPNSTPASSVSFEVSLLDRPLSQTPAGQFATTFSYGTNMVDEVSNLSGGYFAANHLYKQTVIDPNLNQVVTYTDIKKRGILSKRIGKDGLIAETYSQYDDKDRITTVVPPDASLSDAGLIYSYQYDGANNMTYKKIPDQAAITLKYNDRDLLVLTQDGNLGALNNWMLSKYDDYGRVTSTGFHFSTNPDPNADLNYTKVLSETSYDGTQPIEKGKVIQEKVKNLSDDAWLQTDYTYDGFGRVQSTSSNNHVNPVLGAEQINFSYDNADNVLNQTRIHQAFSENLQIHQSHTYDHSGRMIDTYHAIGSHQELVSKNYYNHRDFVIQKRLGQQSNGTYLQYVDYAYNDAGWLTAINDVGSITAQSMATCDTIPANLWRQVRLHPDFCL